jgi:hypothetical protein
MEAQKRIKVFMGIPTVGTVVDAQSYMLRELTAKYGDKVELVYPERCARRIFHDFARNEIVKEFLATDCDVLWFLDSDIGPSKHVLELITLHWDKWKVAGAPYPVFMGKEDPAVVFCVYKRDESGKLTPSNIPYEGVEFVDGLATGCLFIKREVLEQMEAPYFAFKYDEKTREPIEGEDLGFCRKMAEKGMRFFVDYTMVCKHYKTICLLEVQNYAVNYANEQVLKYDNDIRGQVTEAVKKAYAAGKASNDKPKSSLILP